jgi:hypothetical protein
MISTSAELSMATTAATFDALTEQPTEIGEAACDAPVPLKGDACINPTGKGIIRGRELEITSKC